MSFFEKLPIPVALVALTLITLFTFLPVLKNGFLNWDDNFTVLHNEVIKRPMGEVIRHYFGPHFMIGNYIPLTMLVIAAEYKFARLDPTLYHHVSVILHIVNVCLTFFFVRNLSGSRWLAAFVAVLFAVHPMHVESVAWISEQKDLLYTAFFLAALICYVSHARDSSRGMKHYLAASVLFVLSLLSKPAAIIFPLVACAIDIYLSRNFTKRVILEKLPWLVISILAGILALYAQKTDLLLHNEYTVAHRFIFASSALLIYLVKCFFPFDLSIFHPYPINPTESLPAVYYLAPVGVLLIASLVFRYRRMGRTIIFGSLFFLLNLVLVLQVITVGNAMHAERYTYVSYIGVFWIVGWLAMRLGNNGQRVFLIASFLAVYFSVSASRERCRVWRNDLTIADDLIKKYPNDWLALNNKGFIESEFGRYDEAISYYRRALARKPDYVRAAVNLGNAYLEKKTPLLAAPVIDSVLREVPDDFYLLSMRAYIATTAQDYGAAADYNERALRLRPGDVQLMLNLAESNYFAGRLEACMAALNAVLEIEPRNHMALNSKGYLLFLRKKYGEAAALFRQSLAEKPDFSTASANLRACEQALDSLERQKAVR